MEHAGFLPTDPEQAPNRLPSPRHLTCHVRAYYRRNVSFQCTPKRVPPYSPATCSPSLPGIVSSALCHLWLPGGTCPAARGAWLEQAMTLVLWRYACCGDTGRSRARHSDVAARILQPTSCIFTTEGRGVQRLFPRPAFDIRRLIRQHFCHPMARHTDGAYKDQLVWRPAPYLPGFEDTEVWRRSQGKRWMLVVWWNSVCTPVARATGRTGTDRSRVLCPSQAWHQAAPTTYKGHPDKIRPPLIPSCPWLGEFLFSPSF